PAASGYRYPPDAPVGTLRLTRPAPAGGLLVSIVSSNRLLVVPVPDELPIAAGAVSPSVDFYLQVNPVGLPVRVTLIASVAGSTLDFPFVVRPGGPLSTIVRSLTITPATVVGGTTTFAHFTLAAPVGIGGDRIRLESSDPTVATVPSSIPVATGARGGSFEVHTRPLHSPVSRRHCSISAA